MPDLNFQVEKAEPVPYAATPQLAFTLRITEPGQQPPTRIQNIMLRCQIRIEPVQRRYTPAEQEKLVELFGEPPRWSQTLKSLLWTHASVFVPAFTGSTQVDLPVPCSFDFSLAATKYFYGLEDGQAPLCLLFSGTIFYAGPDGRLQVTQIPWEKEAAIRLPVGAWHDLMNRYYPESAWLCLPRPVFDRLYRFKRDSGLATWEQTLESLLSVAKPQGQP
jgi:Family of unknown function (DUF6084)